MNNPFFAYTAGDLAIPILLGRALKNKGGNKMIKPILQIDFTDRSWSAWLCGICGDFLMEDNCCQDCHTCYSPFQMSHPIVQYINVNVNIK
jgi:hypothetical protein